MSGNSLLRRELPKVDERRCTGCGECLRICPTSCLRVVHDVPVVTLEAACISCRLCQLVCAPGAIRMVRPTW